MPHKNTPTFPECLTTIMEKRALSAGQLAEMLQYRSKTTLLRVLQGKAGARCVGNVYTDLCHCPALNLTEAELNALRIAYDVEQFGMDNYRARAEMWRLLRRNEMPQTPMQITHSDGSTQSLDAFLRRFRLPSDPDTPQSLPIQSLDVCVLSGGYPYVMQSLSGLLSRLGDRVHITQLLVLSDNTAQTVRLIRNLLPVLPYHMHEIYYIRQNDISKDPIYAYSIGRAMILRATLSDGVVREFQLLMRDEQHGMALEANGLWVYWQQYVQSYGGISHPLKAATPEMPDYIRMLEYYADTERNREMLIYRSDVCFNMIPIDILLHALTDSPSYTSEIEAALPRLRAIQEKRYQNLMSKRQSTHWVASARALWVFARTGVQKDHFFAMRPFTVEERLRIFRHIVSLVEENPWFHLYLIQSEEEETFVDLEAAYLEGIGLQLTAQSTNYCLDGGWTETLLTEESFCALYREFFLGELLPHHTCPMETSKQVLHDIIEELLEKM